MTLEFAAELPPTPTINVALIGPPKTGKSTGAASAPGPVLYVNVDLPTATRFARLKYPDVHEVALGTTAEGTTEAMKLMVDVTMEVFSPETKFKTVVIDPVGELHRRLLEEQSNRALSPSLPTYGNVSTHLERFMRKMCEAPLNAIFVCHDLPITEEGLDPVVLPFMGTTGKGGVKLGRQLLGMVDVIGYSGVVQTEDGPVYSAQLVQGKGRQAGDRFNALAEPATGGRAMDLTEWVDLIVASEKATTQKTGDKQ